MGLPRMDPYPGMDLHLHLIYQQLPLPELPLLLLLLGMDMHGGSTASGSATSSIFASRTRIDTMGSTNGRDAAGQ